MDLKDREDWEWDYEDAMALYDTAASDDERETALLLAHSALVNLTDCIDQLRSEISVVLS